MNTEQVRQHQQDSHKLGVAPHKKVASELRLFDSAGKPAWHIVQYAGGAAAFVGVTESQTAALVAKGREGHKSATTAASAAISVVLADARTVETAAFAKILAASGTMNTMAIRKCLENPPGSLRSIERDDLLKEIKPQAMAAEQLGRTLNDKEWHKMALQSKWQLLQASSRHMGVDLARYAHIQDFGDGATTAITWRSRSGIMQRR